jgi:hypothetical protein
VISMKSQQDLPSTAVSERRLSPADQGRRPRLWPAVVVILAAFAAYEVTQFALGSCQGYGGTGAFERSLTGGHLRLWSIDPLTCQGK